MKRRDFGQCLIKGIAGASLLTFASCNNNDGSKVTLNLEDKPLSKEPFFKLSLAQWSLHRALQDGDMDHLQFAAKSKSLGFEGVEYVNQFFADKAEDKFYLEKMNQEASQNNIEQLLIMVDGEGGLALPDNTERLESVNNHKKWVDAAKFLGCHSIRVNCFGEGTKEEVKNAGIDGLSRLCEFAAKKDMNVIVENHGGYSSDGQWLAEIMQRVNMPNCGTLPDFGNFCLKREGGQRWGTPCVENYDMYKGVLELMPFAKAVSAKSFDFDENGDETKIDFYKMMSIIKNAGFKGFIGVEYEGESLNEEEGILKTKALLLNAAQKI